MNKKLCICGDIHFGCRNNNQIFVKVIFEFMFGLCNYLKKNDIKTLIMLGDIFDNRTAINIKLLKRLNRIFKEYEKAGIDITIVAGNHDYYYKDNKEISSLDFFENFRNIRIQHEINAVKFFGKDVLFVPWLFDTEEEKAILKKYLNNHFLPKESNPIVYDYMFGHIPINDFEVVENIKEKNAHDIDEFKNIGKCFVGHFHRNNTIKNITFVGTPYELTWNEANNKKGFYILDFETGKETFIENKKSPIHVELKYSNPDYDKCSSNFVKAVIDKNNISDIEIDAFIQKLEQYKPLIYSIQNECSDTLESGYNYENIFVDGSKTHFDMLLEYIDTLKIDNSNIDKTKLIEYIGRLK